MGRKPSLDKWLTSTEAAEKLECTSANIWVLIRAGKLPGATKRGAVYLIPESDVKAAAKYRRKKYRCRKNAA